MAKAVTKQPETLETKLTAKPIPHAYALIEDPDRPGMYFAVHLKKVYAEEVEHLEVSKRSSYREFGIARIRLDMQNRHRQGKGWDE